MSILLDTNALLWLIWGSDRLGPHARSRVEKEARVCVSDLTLFEISLKAAKRKLDAPSQLASLIDRMGILRIGLRDEYLDAMRDLPFHHNDPFDRYLIAQSLVNSAPILTADRAFAQYGVRVIDAHE